MTTTADRREKGSGGITRLANGKYRAFVETTPDPGDGSRRRVSATGRTKSEALRKARDKALRPDMGMTTGGNATVAEWMDHWVDEVIEPRRAPNTTKSYRTRIRMDITPVIGAVPLDRLRPSHVRMVENRILRGDGRTGTDPRDELRIIRQWLFGFTHSLGSPFRCDMRSRIKPSNVPSYMASHAEP